MSADLKDYDLLIVSDLHLSEGRDPATKKLSRNEDFLFDDEFARFLAHYTSQQRWPGRKWHLVINGDFVDFLQVTAHEDAPPDLVPAERREYGLPTGERETVYKLGKIVDGHWIFFQALAEFIVGGNVVSIGIGNHDVEFHYPAVRTALIDQLGAIYRKKLLREDMSDTDIDTRIQRINSNSVRFYDWFLYEAGLYYIEHGSQYDELNSFRYLLAPLVPRQNAVDPRRADDIDLPWGSLFVRYLFNRVEKAIPYADNIKPSTRFIRWFIRHHPIRALKFLFGDGWYMIRKMRRAWQRVPDSEYAHRLQAHEASLHKISHETRIPVDTLRYFDRDLRVPSILKEFEGCRHRMMRLFILRLLYPFVLLLLFALVIALGLTVGYTAEGFLPERLVTFLRHLPGLETLVKWFRKLTWVIAAFGVVLSVSWVGWKLCLHLGCRTRGASSLADGAKRIREKVGVKYVFMGHTHDADLQSIGPKGEEYFNTGTWTKVFSEAERLIREENELVFVQGLRKDGGLVVKLLKWKDEPGRPDLVKLFP